MSIVLARIDDRFIHGQVTVGWCPVVKPDRILLCNDMIAADPWQSRVYASSVPPHLEVCILSLDQTRDLFSREATGFSDSQTLLLVESPADILYLQRGGILFQEVNVGGMHHATGKRELLEYVYVDRDDIAALRGLMTSGTRLKVQSVPGAPVDHIDEDLLDSLWESF